MSFCLVVRLSLMVDRGPIRETEKDTHTHTGTVSKEESRRQKTEKETHRKTELRTARHTLSFQLSAPSPSSYRTAPQSVPLFPKRAGPFTSISLCVRLEPNRSIHQAIQFHHLLVILLHHDRDIAARAYSSGTAHTSPHHS